MKEGIFQKIFIEKAFINPPPFDYESIPNYKDKLIFIEKNYNGQSTDNFIPCLFIDVLKVLIF